MSVVPAALLALGVARASDHPPHASAAKAPEITVSAVGEYPKNAGYRWTDNLQGVASDKSKYWYFAQDRRVWKIPLSADLNHGFARGLSKPISDLERRMGFNHMGDPDFFDGYLYVPMERLTTRRPGAVALRDANLKFIDVVTLAQPGAPWVAVNPTDRRLYSSHFSRVSALLRYPRAVTDSGLSLGFPEPVLLFDETGAPAVLDEVQGGAFSPDGRLYLVTHYGIEGFDIVTSAREGVARRAVRFGIPYRPRMFLGQNLGDELEGIDFLDFERGHIAAPHVSGQLHVVMIDNDGPVGGSDDLYFKHFRVVEPQTGPSGKLVAALPP